MVFAVGETIVLGSNPDCAIVLRDPAVSAYHTMIERIGPGWQVRPLAQAGATYMIDATGRAYPIDRELGLRSGEFLVGPYHIRLFPPA